MNGPTLHDPEPPIWKQLAFAIGLSLALAAACWVLMVGLNGVVEALDAHGPLFGY
jgi:hypothetical protein